MTTTETVDWRTLPAGPELDALVAVRVMGFRRVTLRPAGEIAQVTVFAARNATVDDGLWSRRDVRRNLVAAPYSTDMAAAWPVHLAMCARRFSVRRAYLAAIQAQARTETGLLVAWPDVLVVLRDRMPEVICRAALAASEAP